MRILHVLNHVQEIGNGIVNAAIELACCQAKAGFQVAVASGGGEYEDLMKRYGVQHFDLDQRRSAIVILNAAQKFNKIVRNFTPDIVHTHMMTGVILARVLRGNADYALVSTVHNEWQRSANWMGIADRVITASQAVARSMQQRGIPAHKLVVVPCGTIGSPRRPSLDAVEPLPLKRPAVVTVAGMFPRKGISDLIEAFVQIADEHPAAHLYLVGNGPHRAEFEQQAHNSRMHDRIHFEGFQAEPQRYLLSTDVFVLASHQEPFGLVLAEAREAGCAIVATDVDGIPEVLDHGAAGLLVPAKNPSAIAAALTHLLKRQDDLETWRYRAQQNLDWLRVDRMHEETLEVYRDALAANAQIDCA